jgi:uncharacterized tellurite resistance protein B-like protein
MTNEMEPSGGDDYKKNNEKFLLYLFFCAAYSDYQIKDTEKNMIREKMVDRNLVSSEDFDNHWQHVGDLFKSHNDYEAGRYIEKSIAELNLGARERHKIFRDLSEIVSADGKVDLSEKMNLFKFKKMLKL